MKYEAANHAEPGLRHKAMGFMRRGPEVSNAAKTGAPTMEPPKREIPANIPVPAEAAGFTGDVTVAPVTDPAALETKPDARTPAAPALSRRSANIAATAIASPTTSPAKAVNAGSYPAIDAD